MDPCVTWPCWRVVEACGLLTSDSKGISKFCPTYFAATLNAESTQSGLSCGSGDHVAA